MASTIKRWRERFDGGVFGRLLAAFGVLLSRDIAVLTNAIAFNFLLCLFPLIVVVASISLRLPEGGKGSRGGAALLLLLQELIPFSREALADSLRNLTRIARGLEALSLVMIVWGSSGIFIPVEMALNRAWGGRSRSFWQSRGLAFLMTLAGGTLALLSVALTVATQGYSREWPALPRYGAKASAFLLTYALFFLIYRVIPGAVVRSGTAARAALWSAAAWEAVKYVFVIKLGQMNLQAFYGPLALAVSLILWAYVSSLVLVFGALMVPVSRRPNSRRGPAS
jgi:membrane protein/epoxyqueuosine reductase